MAIPALPFSLHRRARHRIFDPRMPNDAGGNELSSIVTRGEREISVDARCTAPINLRG